MKHLQSISDSDISDSSDKTLTSSYKIYTWPEIIKHDRRDDCWVVIEGKVYDVTSFLPHHPG